MIRTQIQFTEEQLRALKRAAENDDCSVSELVRRVINVWMLGEAQDKREIRRRAASMIGSVNSGLGDLAERHDDYLDEIYGSW